MNYPRDLAGYGEHPPDPKWPGGARIALQFVVNYEEGGENCLLHGDEKSEAFLSEIIGATNWPGKRHANMESIYEYGARAGFWRLYRLFCEMEIPVTVFGVATALARSPEQVEAMKRADWEIASHGFKWIEYSDFSREEEAEHIRSAIALHKAVTGSAPRGWYQGRSSINTIELLSELAGCDYLSDSYADELPYWIRHQGGDKGGDKEKAQLIIPYTLDANDMRFATAQGFNTGEDFFIYLKDSFDALYREGEAGRARMMSIGLHCRLAGRPGRAEGLRRFIDYARTREGVWFARRIDIAEHWIKHHPPHRALIVPSGMSREEFIEHFGGVYEHSPFIAERAYDAGIGAANDHAPGLAALLKTQFRLAGDEERLKVLKAHPDLAGKLASARLLSDESTREQASAGLDALTKAEREEFGTLNQKYMENFGFPFIIAVRDYTKAEILDAFKARLENDRESEFGTACKMVERIAELRIATLMEGE